MSAIHDGRRESATPEGSATLEGFDHASGFHCGSTALRGLADRYGWTCSGVNGPTCSETICFGLGEGIGFTYFTPGSSPDRAFFGRSPGLETTFLDRIGVAYDRRSGDDWARTRDRLETRLANGDPVLLATDVAALPYFDTDTHFAPHRVLCVGLEDGRDREHDRGAAGADRVALIADNEFDDVKRVPLTTLRDAMTDDHLVPIRNRTTVVTDPEPEQPATDRMAAATVEAAIAATARSMLDPAAASGPSGAAVPDGSAGPDGSAASAVAAVTGIEGIRTLAADLPQWVDRSEPRWTARLAAQNVDSRGTGGGAFRRPYASFLERAARVVPALPETAPDRMHGIADDWSRLATTFRRASEAETDAELSTRLAEASRRVRTIADREERFWRRALAVLA
ncbi:BtrH N-terminal domain-containing protein [haloarchaeon 3A1-DGR]|nr:BtrH N-terminal domain-containing protein [haloarchaeon 3A1-DGR]